MIAGGVADFADVQRAIRCQGHALDVELAGLLGVEEDAEQVVALQQVDALVACVAGQLVDLLAQIVEIALELVAIDAVGRRGAAAEQGIESDRRTAVVGGDFDVAARCGRELQLAVGIERGGKRFVAVEGCADPVHQIGHCRDLGNAGADGDSVGHVADRDGDLMARGQIGKARQRDAAGQCRCLVAGQDGCLDLGFKRLVGDRFHAVDQLQDRLDALIGRFERLYRLAHRVEQVVQIGRAVVEALSREEGRRAVDCAADFQARCEAQLGFVEQPRSILHAEQI